MPLCKCGTPFSETIGGGLACRNCDTVQEQEVGGFVRRKTVADVQFDIYWAGVMATEYDPPSEDIPLGWINGRNEDE